MAEFKPGDIAFFRGHAEPVTILGAVHLWNGSDGTLPGYNVIMKGWRGPEDRAAVSLVSFEENLEILELQLERALDDLDRAAVDVRKARDALTRLHSWKEKQE